VFTQEDASPRPTRWRLNKRGPAIARRFPSARKACHIQTNRTPLIKLPISCTLGSGGGRAPARRLRGAWGGAATPSPPPANQIYVVSSNRQTPTSSPPTDDKPLPKNIFWQVAGQITVGTTSHLEGVLCCRETTKATPRYIEKRNHDWQKQRTVRY
jgi:hypothetical protein